MATITSNSTVPADQTVKNVPSVVAPGLAAAGLETCLGSVSGGGAFLGTGFSFGTTIPDPGCAARLDSRTLWSMGLKKAAVARLCLNGDVYRAMPEVCDKYLPPPAPGYPAPPPVPTRYAEQPYTVGDIWLVDGATGKNRLCNDYDVTQQRCRVWAHTVHHSAPKKKAASGETSHTGWAGGFPAMERCTKTDDAARPATKNKHALRQIFPSPRRWLTALRSVLRGVGGMTFISSSSSVRLHAGIPGRRPTRRTRAVAARSAPRQTRVGTRRRKLSEEQPYTGGDIWLVEGATGKNRLCSDYDVTQQRCRVWAHTVHHSAPKKKGGEW